MATMLYPGEEVVAKKGANAIILLKDHSLKALLGTDVHMKALGMGGMEAIGGRLDLTTWRLVFRSHPVNRVTGQFSIILPTITAIENRSGRLVKKMRVSTDTAEYEFVVWGVDKLMAQVDELRFAIDAPRLLDAIAERPDILGSGLEQDQAWEVMSQSLSSGTELAIGLLTDPISVATVANAWEFFRLAQKLGGSPPISA